MTADGGERGRSPWWGVHVARYRFALPHVKEGCRLLDIACGTGYGLAMLRARAHSAVGADIDWQTARQALDELRGGRPAAVVLADGRRLPFRDASFDLITSFETIEHMEERGRFVAELRRALAPDGLCIISTPNANYTRPVDGRPVNPHHVYEYRPEELLEELRPHFGEVELLGQTLDARFRMSPFLDDQVRLPRDLGTRAQLLLWRVLNRLPPAVHDPVSRLAWGHPLIPQETDYVFDRASVEGAPVLVALCRTRT